MGLADKFWCYKVPTSHQGPKSTPEQSVRFRAQQEEDFVCHLHMSKNNLMGLSQFSNLCNWLSATTSGRGI